MQKDFDSWIFQDSSAPWVLLNGEGNVLRVNPAANQLLEIEPAEILNRNFAEFFSESYRATLIKTLEDIKASNPTADLQIQFNSARDRIIPIQLKIIRESSPAPGGTRFHILLESENSSGMEDIQWLSEQGKTLLTLTDEDLIYDRAGQALQQKLGSCIVLTLSNVDPDTLKLEGVYGLVEGTWSRVQDVIGKRLVGRRFHIEERFQQIYRKRSLYHHAEGLEDFASSEIPGSISRQLKKLYGLEDIFTIGLEGEQRVMGCLYIFTRVPGMKLDSTLVESFSFQVALALEKAQFANDLRESEKQFQAVFEFAPDGYYITDPEGKFIDGNRAAEKITGYSREELIGQSFLTAGLIPKRQLPKAGRLLAENLLGRSTGPDELTLTRKDGSTLPIEVSTHPVKIRDRSLVLGIARDISQRKQTALRLDQAQDTLKLVLESVDAHIYVSDLETNKILYMNQRMIDDYGEDFTGEVCYEVFQKFSEACDFCRKDQLLDENGEPAGVKVWEAKNRITGRYYMNHDRAIHWSDEKMAHLQIALDITESRQATEALRASEQRYRKLFDSSQDALMTIAPPDWEITSGNPALDDLFRIDQEDGFLGKQPWELSPEYQPDGVSSRKKALEVIEQAMEHGFSFFQWIHKNMDGEEFPATVQLARVDGEQGPFLQATIRDITERIYSQKILDQQMDDLSLLNLLNEKANQGKSLDEIINLLKKETQKIFESWDTSIYLLDKAGEILQLENSYLDKSFRKSLQRLIGVEVTGKIEIPLKKTEYYQKILSEEQPRIVIDPDIIQTQISDFLQSEFVPDGLRPRIKELVPQIFKLSGIASVISVPLISKGKVIGLMEMSGTKLFTEDVKDRFSALAGQLSGIIERLRAERDRAINVQELELINSLIVEGSRLEDIDDICLMLANRIQDVNPDAYVMLSLYDPVQDSIRVRALTGFGNRVDRVFDLFGVAPTDLQVSVAEFDLEPELQDLFTSGSMVRVPQGIYDLTRGKYPRSVCRSAERLLGVTDTFITGFGLGGESTGGVTLFMRHGAEVQCKSAIETVVSHFSVIIDRRQSESEIKKRTAQLQALREVELDITSQLNLQDLLYSIALRASQMVGGEASGFSIFDPETDFLEFQSFTGDGPLPVRTRMEKGEGLAGKVWEKQETLVVQDYANWKGRDQSWANTLGNFSVAGIPVQWGNEFLGVLEIAFQNAREVNQEEIRLLELFATQAAIAIQNARLFTNEKKRRREAETLREVGLMINQVMDRSDLLDMILESLQKVVPFDSASIQFIQGPDLVLEAFRGPGNGEGVIGKRFDIEEDELIHPVLFEGKKVILGDVTKVGDWIAGPETSNIRSWIAVPLQVRDMVVGVLTVDHHKLDFYTEQDAELGMNFANQAAIAMENARLLEQAKKRQREAETLRDVGMLISKSMDRDEVLNSILDQLQYVLEYTNATIQLLKGDRLVIEAVRGSENAQEYLGTSIAVDQKTMIRSMLMEVEAVVIEDLQQLTDWASFPTEENIRSWLGVPLEIQGKRIGILTVDHHQVGRYTEHDAELVTAFAAQAAIALENSRLFQETQQRFSRIESLREIDLAISGSLNLPTTLDVLLGQLIKTLKVDATAVLLHQPELNALEYVSGRGFQTELMMETSIQLGKGLAGKAALDRKILHISDLRTQNASFENSSLLEKEGFVSYIGVPLISNQVVVGVLEVFNRTHLDPDHEWLDFLEALAGQAAIAIDRLNLYADLERSNLELIRAYDATIEGWARAIELRDGDTEGHSRRVVQLTVQLAEMMGIHGKDLANIQRGALLHDIGKMAIPDAILLKPGPLTDEEWRIMKQHPVHAYKMLSGIEYLRTANEIPYCHHERWDGSGYPRGLSGDEIPLSARIFSVIDVWDALQADRPYRKAWTWKEALSYIQEQSGKQFDPQIVSYFLELINS